MLSIESILVAADFSAFSEDAFRLARALARDYGARLLVLHVATPERDEPDAVTAAHRAATEERLRLVYDAAEVPVTYHVEEGDAAPIIVRTAREEGCDLIALGTHGRSGLRRALLGSVAEQVTREAGCAVITAKGHLAHAPEEVQEPVGATEIT